VALKITDNRYTVHREHSGKAEPRHVVRFCGDWVGSAASRAEAFSILNTHKATRDAALLGLSAAETFFYVHAGYSHSPATETPEQGRERGAKQLAKDEQTARDGGFSFRWSIDPYSDSSEFEKSQEPWQLWQCAMYNSDGRIVNSLHGIDFGRDGDPWSSNYRRVVEAELAREGLTNEPQGKVSNAN
jgi:hypothetical protein